jgi:hypothetical protein
MGEMDGMDRYAGVKMTTQGGSPPATGWVI